MSDLAQKTVDAMVENTGGFAPGDLVIIVPSGIPGAICAVFGGKANCFLGSYNGSPQLSGWISVKDLIRAPIEKKFCPS